jgi:hypothetical protein
MIARRVLEERIHRIADEADAARKLCVEQVTQDPNAATALTWLEVILGNIAENCICALRFAEVLETNDAV